VRGQIDKGLGDLLLAELTVTTQMVVRVVVAGVAAVVHLRLASSRIGREEPAVGIGFEVVEVHEVPLVGIRHGDCATGHGMSLGVELSLVITHVEHFGCVDCRHSKRGLGSRNGPAGRGLLAHLGSDLGGHLTGGSNGHGLDALLDVGHAKLVMLLKHAVRALLGVQEGDLGDGVRRAGVDHKRTGAHSSYIERTGHSSLGVSALEPHDTLVFVSNCDRRRRTGPACVADCGAHQGQEDQQTSHLDIRSG